MRTYQNRKRTHKVLDEIENKFLKEYKLSVEDLVSEYFKPKNSFGYMMSEKKIRGWLNVIKTRIFKLTGDCFGNIDVNGVYGIPTTIGEANFLMKRYYKLAKGINTNVQKVVKDLSNRKILPNLREENTKLLKVINGDN